jgi:hypothetical protein
MVIAAGSFFIGCCDVDDGDVIELENGMDFVILNGVILREYLSRRNDIPKNYFFSAQNLLAMEPDNHSGFDEASRKLLI